MTQQLQSTLGYTMADAIIKLVPADFAEIAAYYSHRKDEQKKYWTYYAHERMLWAAIVKRAIVGELTIKGIKTNEYDLSIIPNAFLLAHSGFSAEHGDNGDGFIDANRIGHGNAYFHGVRVFITADLAPLPATKVSVKVIGKTGPKEVKGGAITRMMLEALQTRETTVDQLKRDKQEFLVERYGKPHGSQNRGTVKRARDNALSLFAEGRNTGK